MIRPRGPGAVLAPLLLLLFGCMNGPPPSAIAKAHPPVIASAPSPAPAARAAAKPPMPLYEGLGGGTRPVTTRSPDAQRYFDQGLALLYSFNAAAAVRSFQRSASLDPTCAMAEWGIALASGPNINYWTVSPESEATALKAIARARELATGASPVEAALIEAQARRFALPQQDDRTPLNKAYADAMHDVWRANPKDADVGALFAEALMDVDPRLLITPAGRTSPGVLEAVSTLEQVLAFAPRHLQANHLYIHAIENSAKPERAIVAADFLRTVAPSQGHLLHMSSHIDVLRGHWADSVLANQRAVAADLALEDREPDPNDNSLYTPHDLHSLAFAAMMRGQSAVALEAARKLQKVVQRYADLAPAKAKRLDFFLAAPFHVLVRFGLWDEILAAPEPGVAFLVARAARHEARGVAFAATDELDSARAEEAAFLEAVHALPAGYRFKKSDAKTVLAVADRLLEGEIRFRAGERDGGLAALREAVRLEDAVDYSEPPHWMVPARHALGASLLKAGRLAEAEDVYRADLARLPNNGWALLGLTRSLRARGRIKEAASVEAQFHDAWSAADITLSSSCFCQPGG